MRKFIDVLILLVVGLGSFVSAQGGEKPIPVRVTQENLREFYPKITCQEVNPLPPITGVTGPLYRGFYDIWLLVNENWYRSHWIADSNADLIWTSPNTQEKQAAYRSCEKATAEAARLRAWAWVDLSLLQRVRNADVKKIWKDTNPPDSYCQISEADLYFFETSPNCVFESREVYKLVPCP
jgi:hypothetical protein